MNIYIKKMGCKVNDYEANSIATSLKAKGHTVCENENLADIAVVVTCAVTNEAEAKSRQMVGSFHKKNPNAKIIVCGCSSENDSEAYSRKDGVVAVLGTTNKTKIIKLVEDIKQGLEFNKNQKDMQNLTYENYEYPIFDRTRHFIKVQDGCNNFCSYCLIPYIRGRSRSRELEDVYAEALFASKYSREIVFTGINVSDYKTSNGEGLAELMLKLRKIDARIRFSSMECNIIDEKLLKMLRESPNFCPHFHLPLQSGCDKTLKDMNRKYTIAEYLDKIKLIRKYFPHAGITTDVIVGYPTETDEDFAITVQTIEKAGFSDIHAFKYSPRKGTACSKLKMLSSDILESRKNILFTIKAKLAKVFIKANVGKEVEMLTENIKDGYYVGYSREYIKLYLQSDKAGPSEVANVRCVKEFRNGLLVELI